MNPVGIEVPAAKPASAVVLLLAFWLFISPWVFGADMLPSAWNGWIVGALIFTFAAIRLSRPIFSGVSWLNVVLGLWTFFSPWIYGYTANSPRFYNSLGVGVAVIIAALISANAVAHRTTTPHHRTV